MSVNINQGSSKTEFPNKKTTNYKHIKNLSAVAVAPVETPNVFWDKHINF